MRACCISGGLLEQLNALARGTPKGEVKDFAGYQTYVSGTSDGEHAVLFFTDAFGLALVNNKIIADMLAEELKTIVYMPDLFDGTAVQASLVSPPPRPSEAAKQTYFEAFKSKLTFASALPYMVPFVIRNRPSTKDALVRKVFQAIPERAVALTGYCYGAAMYKPLLLPKRSDEGRVKAGYIAHPSFTDAKELTALGKTIPLCLAFPEVDFRLSTKDMKDAEKGLKQEAKDAEVTFYPDTVHGFAARPLKADMDAFTNTLNSQISFFKKHLLKSA